MRLLRRYEQMAASNPLPSPYLIQCVMNPNRRSAVYAQPSRVTDNQTDWLTDAVVIDHNSPHFMYSMRPNK